MEAFGDPYDEERIEAHIRCGFPSRENRLCLIIAFVMHCAERSHGTRHGNWSLSGTRELLLTLVWLVAGVIHWPAAALGFDPSTSLFPFVLPWDDAAPGVTDLSGWLKKPAGQFGPVHAGADGHLCTGAERIRFFGVDLAFSANFPTPAEARKISARMAKFGVNIVRFHIMDMKRFPEGILARDAAGTRELDAEALARLDYFTAELKSRGIYTYLCLLNYRPFGAADGLPKEIEDLGAPFQDRHVVGFYDHRMLELQKEYARKLLSHRNAQTGMTYAEDPAVAFVEINNENGLIHAWLGEQVDRLPEVLKRDLHEQWNDWLGRRYGRTASLAQAWGAAEQALGEELLANADFSHGVEHWLLERHPGAEATVTPGEQAPAALGGAKSACIAVTKAGAESWHVRFEQGGIKMTAESAYTLSFWAKAERPGAMSVSVEQDHAPWKELGLRGKAELTPEWQRFHFTLSAAQNDAAARVVFDPPMQAGTYRIAGVSLRSGGLRGLGKGQNVEEKTVGLILHGQAGEHTVQAQRDWMRFLWETEERYWQAMRAYLKGELNVRAMVIGTIVGCSTPNLMAELDCVDAHAYWQHPVFPGQPWDAENWVVRNRTMVNEAGGVLPDLALRRVWGKPFSVTEYGSCAPNTFVSEGHLLRAAYAGLQDWDYISASRYAHRADWDLRRIRNFFDLDQHPTKMLTLIPAAAMFLRGDVKAAQVVVTATLDRQTEIEALRHSSPWELVHAGTLGVARETALIHRTAMVTEGQPAPAGALRPDQVRFEDGRYVSDTDELVWDLARKEHGVVTVNTTRSKAVIGYGYGRKFALGQVSIEPGPTLQEGWSAITLTVMEGDSVAAPARLLVTATGYAENTNMGWKNAEKSSVGSNWGQAPSLVEGIPARIRLPQSSKTVEAWALDERGQRKAQVAVEKDASGIAVVIGPQYRTLWYEVLAR